jgi:hypothetical protein
MPNDVFISYSRRDEPFIKQLYQVLIDQGISTWYDRENIGVGNHWATDIVEGIRDCKVFVLALSPDSAGSVYVRKEVDLAQRYERQIIPLIWRPVEIPVAMEFQLAGIQWIEFNETATAEKFNQLANVVRRLMGGSSMTEATGDIQIAKESTIPAFQAEAPPAPAKKKLGGRRRLGGLKKKPTVQPMGIGAAVISSVIVTLGLDVEEQDFVNGELKWLFSALDNTLKVRRGDVERAEPVAVAIPEDAERDETANNQLLNTVDDFNMQIWEGQIESGLKRINIHLKNLNILLGQEAIKGEAGKGDVYLQNQIKGGRSEIVRVLQEMAQLMNQSYGVLVTSPDQVVDLLG